MMAKRTIDPEKKREYDKRYREKNREKVLAYYREYNASRRAKKRKYNQAYMDDPKKAEKKRAYDRQYNRRRRAKQRQDIFDALGGAKCARCGFDDIRALQIDHVLGNGYEERKLYPTTTQYYKKILAAIVEGSEDYQVLCANCNQIKRYIQREWRDGM
jgi:hypothetical protein